MFRWGECTVSVNGVVTVVVEGTPYAPEPEEGSE